MLSHLMFAIVLVVTSTLCVTAALLLFAALRKPRKQALPELAPTGEAAFLFDDKTLVDTNPRGAAVLESLTDVDGEDGSPWEILHRYLVSTFPGIQDALQKLEQGARFRLASGDEANLEVMGDALGDALRLTLIDQATEDSSVQMDRLSYRALQDELGLLRGMTEGAPMLLWREDAKGEITWANETYLRHATRLNQGAPITWPLPQLFPPVEARDGHTRLSLPGTSDTQETWFDVTRAEQPNGVLNYALPADDAYKAERTKREFIQTLTKTFATLPIGLAVFDHARRLQMFNPALTDLTGLEPEFLLSSPGIEGFLNRMREKHVLPEPRDYRSWSRRLLEIEPTGAGSDFEETWTLPTGQTYRVSARPHPDGGLAFLVEDITSEIHLTRNFRAGMETSQSVLNQLDAAICVFTLNGQLVLTNDAFSQLWTLEGEDSLGAVTLSEAIENWRDAGDNPALWTQIAEIAQPGGTRQSVQGKMTLSDGEVLFVDARRMATGSLMLSFTGPTVTNPAPTPRAQVLRAMA